MTPYILAQFSIDPVTDTVSKAVGVDVRSFNVLVAGKKWAMRFDDDNLPGDGEWSGFGICQDDFSPARAIIQGVGGGSAEMVLQTVAPDGTGIATTKPVNFTILRHLIPG